MGRLRRGGHGRDPPQPAQAREGRRAAVGRRPLQRAGPAGQGGPWQASTPSGPAPDGPAGRHEVEPAQRPLRDPTASSGWPTPRTRERRPSPSRITRSSSRNCSPTTPNPASPAANNSRARRAGDGHLASSGMLHVSHRCPSDRQPGRNRCTRGRAYRPSGPGRSRRAGRRSRCRPPACCRPRVSAVTRRSKCCRSKRTVELAALDRVERLAEHVGQERGDPLKVFGGADRLAEDAAG